jgi:hypothetical protein
VLRGGKLDSTPGIDTVEPLVFDILDDAGSVAVPPAGVDREPARDAGVFETAFISQSRFLEKLSSRRSGVGFARLEATGNGLPEVKGSRAPEQQHLVVAGSH